MSQQEQQIANEDLKAQSQQYGELHTRAWINKKAFGFYKDGFMKLRGGRVSFVRNGNQKVFDSPLSEVQGEFPKYMWGGGCKLTVGGQRYFVAFNRPGSQSVIGAITSYRAWKRWKSVLTNS